jgi:hypothetical protein
VILLHFDLYDSIFSDLGHLKFKKRRFIVMDHGQIFYLNNSSFGRPHRIEVAVQHGVDKNQSVSIAFFETGTDKELFSLDKNETEKLLSKITSLWKGEPLDIKI